MSTSTLLCVGAFWLAYYYFILRKYNTLGFRMFSLFFITGLTVCYWWYLNDRDLKRIQHTGVAADALVLKKTADSLQLRFTDQTGKTIERTQQGGISVQEMAAVTEGQTAPILYSPSKGTVFLASSYQRQIGDSVYFLFFPGLLFVIAIGCWIFLSKYRVHAREGSLYEYVTDESGNVVLDDASNRVTRGLRTYTTMSKLFSLFRR